MLGAGRWGSGNLGRVGQLEGCQVSEREYKGGHKGVQGGNSKGRKNKWECAMFMPCIYVTVSCVQRMIEPLE